MAPFTLLPDWAVVPVFVTGSFALAGFAIRSLGLPLWWVSFWPIVDGALVGNPDVAVLFTLVIAHRRFDTLAPLLKIYAVLPLVGERRWRSLAVLVVVLAVTAPILPWGLWLEAIPSSTKAFDAVAQPTSFGNPILMVVAGVALLSMGIRRAAWLAVPVLWPWTQPHYLAMSTPALTPLLAIVWGLPVVPPIVMLGSIVVAAVGYRFLPAKPEPHGAPPQGSVDRLLPGSPQT